MIDAAHALIRDCDPMAGTLKQRRPIAHADARRLALALPGAVERSHFKRPDFRVGTRIFATLPDDPRCVILKSLPANTDALTTSDPLTYSDEWRGRWLKVRLDRVTRARFRELLHDAWALVAPKRLVMANVTRPASNRG
jgi:hypothetical protein